MTQAIVSSTPPLVSPAPVAVGPRAPQDVDRSRFDQHLELAQRTASKQPASARTDDGPSHSDRAAQAAVKPSAPGMVTRSLSPAPPTASTSASAGSTRAPVSNANAADRDASAGPATPEDPAPGAGLLALLGAAMLATTGAGDASAPAAGPPGVAAATAGAGAATTAGIGNVSGDPLSPTEAPIDLSDAGLPAQLAAGAMPSAAVAATALREGSDTDVSPQLMQPVALPPPSAGAAPLAVRALPSTTPASGQPFQQALGQQVIWLTGQEIKQASIRLHPQDLGQLDIRVSVNSGSVDVVFNTQHPAAASAVQQSLPQLATMLAQHGLALGHAEVGHRSPGQPPARDPARGRASPEGASPDETMTAAVAASSVGTINLLDAFA